MKKAAHNNSKGVETTLLMLIAAPLNRPKVFAIDGLQPFEPTGSILNDTTSNPPGILANQATATVVRWGIGDQRFSFGSVENFPKARRELIGQSSNDGMGMNLIFTIRGNCSHITTMGGFDIFI